MKLSLFIFLLFSQATILSQEVCDNGIDDDSDGLIDYRDTVDCSCKLGLDTTYRLIPNSSFEDTNCCPFTANQMNCVQSWIKASEPTPDYFNTCGNTNFFTPLINPAPLPLPNGKGYIGFLNGDLTSPEYKEYVGTRLSDTLFAGVPYQIRFNIAHGKGAFTTTVNAFGSASHSDIPFGITGPTLPAAILGCPTLVPTFVALDSTTVITSATNWTQVTLSFVPPMDLTTLIIGPNCAQMSGMNYYYLDGIYLNKGTKEPIVDIVDTGNYCQGSLRLFAHYDSIPLSFQWYKDSIAIIGANNSNYLVPIGKPGNYQVKLEFNSGCVFKSSFLVKDIAIPMASFYYDTVCEGLSTSFTNNSTLSNGSIISWKWEFPSISTVQSPSHTFPVSGTTPVSLQVKSDSGCMDDTTINVVVHPKPKALFTYSPSQIFLYNSEVCFSNTSTNSNSYLWNFGFSGASIARVYSPCYVKFPNQKGGTYTVKLVASNQFGCVDSTSLNVIISKGNILFIPNSFTPNEDDKNESFKPIMEGVVNYEFVIFNKWGERIFETTNIIVGWDGKYKGEEVQQGSYVYRILTKNESGEVNEVIGHVNLFR